MKIASKLVGALGIVGLAAGISVPVAAVPEDPPNDNVCICHQTQQNKNQTGEANENQKSVLICIDPNGKNSEAQIDRHLAHGDFEADPELGCEVGDD